MNVEPQKCWERGRLARYSLCGWDARTPGKLQPIGFLPPVVAVDNSNCVLA